MDAKHWSEIEEPGSLVAYLGERDFECSERKDSLLAVACCRLLWELLPERQLHIVEMAEHMADEQEDLSDEEWSILADDAEDGSGFREWGPIQVPARRAICYTFVDLKIDRVFQSCANALASSELLERHPQFKEPAQTLAARFSLLPPDLDAEFEDLRQDQLEEMCPVVLEIFGHMFHEIEHASVWLTRNDETVKTLALRIYDERRFHEMPILGDALEEAGCTDQRFFEHCRGPNRHFLGCWVLDSLLGKV